MALGWIAFEPVNGSSLGRSERKPVTPDLLERDKELLTALHCLGVEFVSSLELTLEGKFPHQ